MAKLIHPTLAPQSSSVDLSPTVAALRQAQGPLLEGPLTVPEPVALGFAACSLTVAEPVEAHNSLILDHETDLFYL